MRRRRIAVTAMQYIIRTCSIFNGKHNTLKVRIIWLIVPIDAKLKFTLMLQRTISALPSRKFPKNCARWHTNCCV